MNEEEDSEDNGVIIAVGMQDNELLRIDFGTQVQWLTLPPDQAVDLAYLILKHAIQSPEALARLKETMLHLLPQSPSSKPS